MTGDRGEEEKWRHCRGGNKKTETTGCDHWVAVYAKYPGDYLNVPHFGSFHIHSS